MFADGEKQKKYVAGQIAGEEATGRIARPQLVLDIGGVLATNLSPFFWNKVSEAGSIPIDRLYAKYKQELSHALWTGTATEEQFWQWMERETTVNERLGKAILAQSLQPLPALQMIPEWSKRADIHILSNHVETWVEPVLRPLRPYLSEVFISSKVGMRKPDKLVYEHVAAALPLGSHVLFVDDQPKNLVQAMSVGWDVLVADEEGQWTRFAANWLGQG
ncbi:HAD-IA family hydrolase [Paenibacillus sp. GCM10027627]|uniref:HAD-IA family hydrolase n=1 Tax=unclassified Paenibacillus TaxID=185978 RepID=UPI0036453447